MGDLAEDVYAFLRRRGWNWDSALSDKLTAEVGDAFGAEVRIEGTAPFSEIRSHYERKDKSRLTGGLPVLTFGGLVTHTVYHRDIEGEHVTDGDSCWCRPLVELSGREHGAVEDELERRDG